MENITVVLLGLLVCMIRIVCHAQEITYINKDIIRTIGEMAQLSCCTIGNYNDIPVCWFKLNTAEMIKEPLLLSNSGTLVIPTTRFTVHANAGCYHLTINDIQEIDDDIYQCVMQINVHTKLSAQVMLKVKKSPVILNNSTKSLFVTEGEPVRLECYAKGYPNPKIFWKRTNAKILPAPHVGSAYRGNILQISQVNRKDRGTYSCIADNGVGRGARYSVAIHVKCAPSVTTPETTVPEVMGKNINLECHVDAFPTPAIIWFKNGKQLYNNNDHYSISERIINDEITAGILSIVTIIEDSYGDYICRAINGLGTAEAVIKLVPASIPFHSSFRVIEM